MSFIKKPTQDYMKNIILYFFIFLNCYFIYGQKIPQGINYQGIARDNNGKELSNQKLSVQVEIIENNVSLYSERHDISSNQFGLFNLIIGRGSTTSSLAFDRIPWENGNKKFIKTSIDFNGDGTLDLQGNTELLSVPYSFYSLTSGSSSNTLSDGSIYLKDAKQGIYLTSPNGSCFFVTINDKGELQTEKKDCPKD